MASQKIDQFEEMETPKIVNESPENQFEYVDEKSIDEDLLCAVCLKPMVTPTTTNCGHPFCKSCLSALKICPMCREPLLPDKFVEERGVTLKLLEKYSIHFCRLLLHLP